MLPRPVRILLFVALAVLVLFASEPHGYVAGVLVLVALTLPVLRVLAAPERAGARGGLGALATLLPLQLAFLLAPQDLWVPYVVEPLAAGPSEYIDWYGSLFQRGGAYFGDTQCASAIALKILLLLCAGLSVLALARAPRGPAPSEAGDLPTRASAAGPWFGPVTIRLVLPVLLLLLAINTGHGWPFEISKLGWSERSASPLGALGDLLVAYGVAILVALPFSRRKRWSELAQDEGSASGEPPTPA